MRLWAVTMVKDEADVIEGTLRQLDAEGVDGIIVADNASTDNTRRILDRLELDCELVVEDDPDPAYRQSEKITALAAKAAERGATWIIPFDADEVWYAEHRLRNVIEEADERGNDIANADLFDHYPSAIDPPGADPFETIQWRRTDAAPLPKVAFRWHPEGVVHQGNHGYDSPDEPRTWTGRLGVRHFPYRSPEQFIRKARNGAAAYAATDLPENVGAHWRQYGALLERYGEESLREVFTEHFWFLAPVTAGLIHDPAPYLRWG